jgi:hypothetical protein
MRPIPLAIFPVLLLSLCALVRADTAAKEGKTPATPVVKAEDSAVKSFKIHFTEFLVPADSAILSGKAKGRFDLLNTLVKSGKAEVIHSDFLANNGTPTVHKSVKSISFPTSYSGDSSRPVPQDYVNSEIGLAIELTAVSTGNHTQVQFNIKATRSTLEAAAGAKKDPAGYPSQPIVSASSVINSLTTPFDTPLCIAITPASPDAKEKRSRVVFISVERDR